MVDAGFCNRESDPTAVGSETSLNAAISEIRSVACTGAASARSVTLITRS
jgi:hypothetical protein